jgi:outer membrane protein assembly factor BamA
MRYVPREMRGRLMIAMVALVAARPALAAPPDPDSTIPDPAAPPPDADPDARLPYPEPAPPSEQNDQLGSLIQIERIDVTGNTATQAEIVRRALPIRVGDVLRSGDPRLGSLRFKVLALGYFRDATVALDKGSQRGQVIVQIHVAERGTIALNRLWFGTTSLSPWWLGADIGERNLFGLGIGVGGGFVYAHQTDLPSARDQYAAELRLTDPSVRGSSWGISWATTLIHGSEPYRVAGTTGNDEGTHRAFPYRRFGLRLGAARDISTTTRLVLGLRAEAIDATLPIAPTHTLPGGQVAAVDLHLRPGASRVMTASFGIDRDTRPDPILPHAGDHLLASAELGSSLLGGDYNFATLFGGYEHYWPLHDGKRAIALKLSAGVILGDAPRFDRIYIADVDPLAAPRALGLVLSTAAPLALLGTRDDKPVYGDLGGTATAEYAFQLFRGSGERRIYGADLFIGAGLWGLAERSDLRSRDTGFGAALPVDAYVNAGVRIDTDIGIFELTVANAVGRLR